MCLNLLPFFPQSTLSRLTHIWKLHLRGFCILKLGIRPIIGFMPACIFIGLYRRLYRILALPNPVQALFCLHQLYAQKCVFFLASSQGRIQSWALGGPSNSFYCLFHAKSFLTQLFAIGNVTVWGTMAPGNWIHP